MIPRGLSCLRSYLAPKVPTSSAPLDALSFVKCADCNQSAIAIRIAAPQTELALDDLSKLPDVDF